MNKTARSIKSAVTKNAHKISRVGGKSKTSMTTRVQKFNFPHLYRLYSSYW